MQPGPVSPLEERLAAHIQQFQTHSLGTLDVHRGDDPPVVDGWGALRVRPLPAQPSEPIVGPGMVVAAGADEAGVDEAGVGDRAEGAIPQEARTALAGTPEPDPDVEPDAAPAVQPEETPVDACLAGVVDTEALAWAALSPGSEAVAELAALSARLTADLATACLPVDDHPTASDAADLEEVRGARVEGAPSGSGAEPGGKAAGAGVAGEPPGDPGAVSDAVSDAVLVEAVAAAERCLAHVSALRDVAAGVFARRRRTEAEADVAHARAATARDGVGRPWATTARSTAPTELAARLGVSSRHAGDLLDRGVAALDAHREVNTAMATGALSSAAGSWLLDQLVELHATTSVTTHAREGQRRTEALAAQRVQEDDTRDAAGLAPLSAAQSRARDAADAAQVQSETEATARLHADEVTRAVRRELLARVTGTGEGTGGTAETAASPEGLGITRAAWGRHLARAVTRADPAGAATRAKAKRAERQVTRWAESDGQACLQLRGPAEDVALIGAAMDARAKRRRADAWAAERASAAADGRRFNRTAVGSLDAHRFEALKEWAVAALELAGTSGVAGTWYPVARTAASRPVVNVTLPVTVPLGVTSVGAYLAGYGPIGEHAARRIADEGIWRRVFTDPMTGVAVGVEESTYRPNVGQRRLVGLRHRTSTMPGSTRTSEGADLDHIVPWQANGTGGATTVTNLQPLATAEHLLKQAGEHGPVGHGWRVVPGPPEVGGMTWRAPTGHQYLVLPDVLDEGPPDPQDWLREPLDGWPGDYDQTDDEPADWSTFPFADDPPDDPDDPTG